MSGRRLRIATRKSALARWQAEHVADLLSALPAVDEVELVPLVTTGDRVLDRSLAKIGGKGLFIKELERAMADGEADIAVHSMKDVPTELPDGFALAAVLERADPADAMVGAGLAALPRGACVGTSSLRRQAQLLARRPDLEVRPVRGNVDTRLAKLEAGEFDAILLATAGLVRLGLGAHITERLRPRDMLPAAGQGAIGIECREDDAGLRELLAALEHPVSRAAVAAERAVASTLGADCHSPVAAFAEPRPEDQLRLRALVATPDGARVLSGELEGSVDEARALGGSLASRLLGEGAAEVLRAAADAAG